MERTEQEKFLVGKMVDRVKQLNHENGVFERKLAEPNLSDEDYDLYQGLMDRNIGEQMAYRRIEDNLREWRTDHAPKLSESDTIVAIVENAAGQVTDFSYLSKEPTGFA